jgi:GxxExxY protein
VDKIISVNLWTKNTQIMTNEFLFKDETYKIIGAAMEVHKELGCGFLEAVYQEAFELELQKQNIPYEREALLNIYYKGTKLKKHYSADFICYKKIVVELKALGELNTDHEPQLLNYLKTSGLKLGLLMNFGSKSLQYKRLIF